MLCVLRLPGMLGYVILDIIACDTLRPHIRKVCPQTKSEQPPTVSGAIIRLPGHGL